MSYLEVRPGVNLNTEQIISVEEVDMMTCKITTSVGVYESTYPSWRILMQLENINEQPVKPEPPVDRVNLWGKQYFAG